MSDTPTEGPLSIAEAIAALPPEPAAADTPETEVEETPDVDPVESTEEVTAEPEEEAESDEGDPYFLDLGEYGDFTIPVKVNGEETQVSLKDAANGFQLQSDYSRKTQALAEERRAFEAERDALVQKANQQSAQLAELMQAQSEPKPKLSDFDGDHFAFIEATEAWETKQAIREAAMTEAREAAKAEHVKRSQAEAAQLVEMVPEFKDAEIAKSVMTSTIQNYGFKAEEVTQTIDHRILAMAHDAMKYRQLKASDPTAKAVKRPPKVVKPGTQQTASERKAGARKAADKVLDRPHSVQEHLAALRQR